MDVPAAERLLGVKRIFSFGRHRTIFGLHDGLFLHHHSDAQRGYLQRKGKQVSGLCVPGNHRRGNQESAQNIEKKYFDASHHGYAYILGPAQERYRAFDDGEPNHSTGDPILGQIRSRKLTDVLVVVVRYFGGTQLGIGGLIAAYRASADAALSGAAVIEKEVKVTLKINFEFSATQEVMKMIKEFGIKILDQEFGEKSHMRLEVSLRREADLLKKIDLLRARGSALGIGKD